VKGKVLLADDDPAIIESVTMLLEDEGYRVVASVGPDTVALVESQRPDVVLLDLWMSGVDGRNIITLLKTQAQTSHIPIIVISANRDFQLVAQDFGVSAFLAKPFEIQDLLDQIAFVTGQNPSTEAAGRSKPL
jgi:CheY-like chemotaxis protein